MIQEISTVLWNECLGHPYYRIGLTCSDAYRTARPGQFVMVHLLGTDAPLLRRPFSIHRCIDANGKSVRIELLYKVVGKCTDAMSRLKPDNQLDLLGPLGKGFRVNDEYSRIHIVAGGIGVAPMVFLAETLSRSAADPSRCRVFLGGRTKEDILCQGTFESFGMDTVINTDDGSAGNACLVTEPFETAAKEDKPDVIYACGPMDMLKCVSDVAETNNLFCQVSIESAMACGMGACLGCAVEKRGDQTRYYHVCVDGPVFNATDLNY